MDERVRPRGSTPTRSREIAAAWGVPAAYADITEVAGADINVVHIWTPNVTRVPYAVEMMQAAKHVICEKPLGVAATDAPLVEVTTEDSAAILFRTLGGVTGSAVISFESFVADSYAAVQGSVPDGLPTFVDGLRAARICDAMLTSAAQGTWVNV